MVSNPVHVLKEPLCYLLLHNYMITLLYYITNNSLDVFSIKFGMTYELHTVVPSPLSFLPYPFPHQLKTQIGLDLLGLLFRAQDKTI